MYRLTTTTHTTTSNAVALLVVFIVAVAPAVPLALGQCDVAVTQTKTSSWGASPIYTQWSVEISASSSTQVTSLALQVVAKGIVEQLWEMVEQTSGYYTLPDYVLNNGGIKAGASHVFGYTVQSEYSAEISVNSITCAADTNTAPTQVPTTTAPPTTTLRVAVTTRSPTIPTTTTTATPTTATPVSMTTTKQAVPPPSTSRAPATTPTTTRAPSTTTTTRAPTTTVAAPTTMMESSTTTTTMTSITYDKICDVVVVVDNYIVRTNPSDIPALREKYTNYFSDVNFFYQKNFNVKMNLLYMHFEEGSPFSDTTSEGELLDAFRSALVGGFFGPSIPISACAYHLITGRDVVGIGGLAWIGTACSNTQYNAGFTVDVQSQEDPYAIVRTMIHEIGHTLGGMHSDDYAANPLYSCNPASGNPNRVLRSLTSSYLNGNEFISDCASTTMRNSMPSFTCLYQTAPANTLPSITFYSEENFAGTSNIVYARNGIATNCYDIVYPYTATASSFQLGGGVSGVRVFAGGDCTGQVYDFKGTLASAFVGDAANKQAYSFQFLL